ncbi:MAG TPA: metal-dependent hydrolase [Kofleriaceae bacterium]|jgi:L-ascorbate metabolism protein UlaG (beta-lactamase superfamily)|nr:metal-dependent hydrolase [Kofleriaceae bacterium]
MKLSLISLALLAAVGTATAQPAPAPARKAGPRKAAAATQVTWLGHAAFRIVTPSGKTLLVDPWLSNPSNPTGKDEAKSTKADLILITHAHFDHVGDATDIAKRTKAKLVATFDLGNAIVGSGFPKDQFGMDTGGNFGGTLSLLDGEVNVTFVPAIHSSVTGDGKAAGNPGGFVIAVTGGPTIYHTGDTDVFGDMAQIGRFKKIDLMLACIGGHFTMDPRRAAEAAKLVRPKQIAPMHYGTFPVLKGTPAELGTALKKSAPGVKLVTLEVGKPITL